MILKIPDYIKYVLDKIEAAGFEAFVVGGCVRDAILGLTPKDYDVTTSADTDNLKIIFKDDRVIETGIQHGTITVLSGVNPVEVTTYRIDGDYEDHRHPNNVKFTKNLSEDLKRRDFTVNAMAYSPKRGLIDEHGGVFDLENKIIRTVGEADERFSEDALRILRGLRFSARFNFEIEQKTSEAMLAHKDDLLSVSSERIFKELCGILSSPGDGLHYVLSRFDEIFFTVIPELRAEKGCEQVTIYHNYDVWNHTLLSTVNIEDNIELRLAMLLHDIGKPVVVRYDRPDHTSFIGHDIKSAEMTDIILKRLKAPNKIREKVVTYVKYHEYFKKIDVDPYSVGNMLGLLGTIEDGENLVKIFRADLSSKSEQAILRNLPTIDNIESEIYNYKINNKCFTIQNLEVSGNELMDMGVPKGKAVGEMLQKLLDSVMREEISNSKQALVERAKLILRG